MARLLALLMLLLCAPGFGQVPEDGAPSEVEEEADEEPGAAALPVASPSPAPQATQTGATQLSGGLEALTRDRLFSDAVVGLQVVNARTGEELFGWQADRPMMPASVMKLLTSAAALRTLGPAWRFSTWILNDGEITAEGVLKGNLYVRGGGDPTLVVEKLWRLVGDLRMAGVQSIEGDVIFDDSYFEGPSLIPGWDKEVDLENGPSYYAPLSALSVNYNTVCVVIAPGTSVGSPARVEVETPVPVVVVESAMTTGRAGSRRWLRVEREVDEKGEVVTLRFRGNVPLDAAIDREYRTVADPLAYFIAVFRGVLDERKMKVKGKFRRGTLPREATLLVRLDSPPLATVLAEMNKQSSNFMAEQLLRTLGAEVVGLPGTTEKGIQVVRDYLSDLGLPATSYALVNGSGLSRAIQVPPSVVTAVILDMSNDRRVAPEFLSSLAIGGVDGTLWARFRDGGLTGRVRGKTGSLNGVYCLAGVVEAGDGETYAFAILANDLHASSWPVKRLLERFADVMVNGVAAGAG